MQYNKLIIFTAFLTGLCVYAHCIFPPLAGNIIYGSLCIFLFQILLYTIILKLVFDSVLKKYLTEEYHKKASIISYISFITYALFDALKHIIFSQTEKFQFPIIPLLLPAWLIIFFFFIFKSKYKLSKKAKIISVILISALTLYSVFCETNIILDLINQMK